VIVLERITGLLGADLDALFVAVVTPLAADDEDDDDGGPRMRDMASAIPRDLEARGPPPPGVVVPSSSS
jgi:hypothetical protein